ncbi:small multi-drug export protein [Candidatus Woesearchaeota archaeon]|nr:small multi-drug export protein [Candidatus Woesearchaeota archaeon]
MDILNDILNISWITFLPFLELRASIPYGLVATKLHWSVVLIIAAGANIILGILLYLAIGNIVSFAQKNRFLDSWYRQYVERTQRRIKPLVDKYGEWALAVFIGIPLPGTGVYSGALAGYLLGMPFRKFLIAAIAGVVIAGVLVVVVSLTGIEAFRVFIKPV